MTVKRCSKCKRKDVVFGMKANGRVKQWCVKCCNRARAETRRGTNDRSGENYKSRNSALQAIGFPDYQAYLKSDLWRSIRRKVYAAKGSNCFICGKPAELLHHNRYHKNDLQG